MRIVVLGTGGVGGYFGGRLAHAGKDVTFIARGAMLDALRTRGLRVDSINGDLVLPNVNATDDPSAIGKVDAVLVCVKSWQVRAAVESIRPAIGDDTIIVPLENGMEAPDDIAAAAGREHAAGGLCGLVSFVVAPGHVHAGIWTLSRGVQHQSVLVVQTRVVLRAVPHARCRLRRQGTDPVG